MKTILKFGFLAVFIIVLYIAFGMLGNDPNFSRTETVLSNVPEVADQSGGLKPHSFPQGSAQSFPSHQIPQGMQVVRSLLGLEVTFLNGKVNYPGPFIVNDFRFQALAPNERLVDSIQFQPLQGPPFLLLIAIGKNPNGSPVIIPGKFDILRKTERGGFVLRDAHGRVFYYSGYVLPSPAWRNLTPGQTLQDQFCKMAVPMEACSAPNRVRVLLKKPTDPKKDIPFLTMVK